ncbi:hypothetical protein RclHR1_14360006 [Rhizophagus clarus]|uniref:GOLD domain-containing protein n=1 Tax=Rhizophagus clarus TaxID=94130 RepID=A0A2Z6QCJ5_9GLOM|nr:hypothetical protein RclHR1_14360006 [Rhizophagus clarus]
MRFLLVIFLFLSAICLAAAHTIAIPANTKECFFEDLQIDDKMTITFQVGDGGHLDIDFWISDPSDYVLESAKKETTATYSLIATRSGRYTYCFSNEMSTVTEKIVSFNVHGVYHVDGGSHTDPLENEIRELADGLAAIKDEQEYIVIREQRHRDSNYFLCLTTR